MPAVQRFFAAGICFLMATQAFSTEVLSFKAWRSRRVIEAKSQVSQIKETMRQQNRSENSRTADLKNRLEQELLNVKIAQELSANDYFVLYLTEQFKGDEGAVLQAVKRMSQKEVAEILINYQKRLMQQESEARLIPRSALLDANPRPIGSAQ